MTPAERNELRAAFAVRLQADTFPRHGEGWPQDAIEEAAEAILARHGHPVSMPLSVEQAAAWDERQQQDAELKRRSNAAYAVFSAAERAWKRNRADKRLFADMKRADSVYKGLRAEMNAFYARMVR